MKWINDLVDGDGNYLPHLLPVDPTLHWANPPGGTSGRDTRPDVHRHPGSLHGPGADRDPRPRRGRVGDESDGYPEAWYLPAAGNIPAGYATEGTWYDFFADKAPPGYGVDVGARAPRPSSIRTTTGASTNWYHDHTLGMTRLNVYAGPAGFYLIRGGPGDDVVLDTRTGSGRAARAGAEGERQVPAEQDLRRDPDRDPGPLLQRRTARCSTRTRRDVLRRRSRATTSRTGAFSPIWNPEFFGNTIMVNGSTWPYLEVEQRRYRFRFLNGCQSRFLILDFGEIGRRGLADRHRGRLPRRTRRSHRRPRTGC